MDKEDARYMHNGILPSYKKKNAILPFTINWMDLEGIVLTKTLQFHLYMESKKQQKRNRLVNEDNKVAVARGEVGAKIR